MPIVNIPAPLQQFTNHQEKILTHHHSLKKILEDLISAYPALKPYLIDSQGNPASHVGFYINHEDYRFLSSDFHLEEKDTLTIVPAIAGG